MLGARYSHCNVAGHKADLPVLIFELYHIIHTLLLGLVVVLVLRRLALVMLLLLRVLHIVIAC